MDPTRSSAAGTKDAIAHAGDQWPELAICCASWGDEEGKSRPKDLAWPGWDTCCTTFPSPFHSGGFFFSGFYSPVLTVSHPRPSKQQKWRGRKRVTKNETKDDPNEEQPSASRCVEFHAFLTDERCRTTSNFNDKPVWGRAVSNNSKRWCSLSSNRVFIHGSNLIISACLLTSRVFSPQAREVSLVPSRPSGSQEEGIQASQNKLQDKLVARGKKLCTHNLLMVCKLGLAFAPSAPLHLSSPLHSSNLPSPLMLCSLSFLVARKVAIKSLNMRQRGYQALT